MKRMVRGFRLVVAMALVALILAVSSGTAAAAPNETPAGFCGALNMLQSWGVGARGGMENAMSVDNANGNTGMATAVGASDCRTP